ncbi:ABC transporter substrate-binding protein [Paracoccus aminophilus]|uniref:ABC transporter periplasmic solute-binding protein n=1 Tax=Paracoccus aminophilus JCM 7686 TaxID=1367847 RepID=S5YYX9_PARAH|nr:ABC transporter substrate-binding protein [Paracoccus aminophilus]AGT10421.1 ABC transporter periplasmic solute-binding protein [Paracoccus aminophilus JCM 7686]
MKLTRRTLFAAAAALALTLPAAAEPLPNIRIGTIENGPLSWEVETIRTLGLDKKHGFAMTPIVMAAPAAAQSALKAGKVNLIFTDWLWVAGERGRGTDLVVAPNARLPSSLIVKADSADQSPTEFKGRKIGINGSPEDGGWLLLRASGLGAGIDLAIEAKETHASPEVLRQELDRGELAALVEPWPAAAVTSATGLREMDTAGAAATALGAPEGFALQGYALQKSWLDHHSKLASDFFAAAAEARQILSTDDAEWDKLRNRMGAPDDARFAQIKGEYRAGIVAEFDPAKAEALYGALTGLEGGKLFGGSAAPSLPEGLFHKP